MTQYQDDPAGLATRRDRTVQEYEHDTYKLRGKLPEPTVCRQCGAVFHKGRWTWAERPPKAHEAICPACHRTNDHYPQGILTLSGPFLAEHKDEILGLVRNEEAQAKQEHPLERIISIKEHNGSTVIATTDIHLTRRIGEALHRAYHGAFTFHYEEGEKFLRAAWSR